MSWSLQLRNGDLFHHQGRYATVQGPSKIAQDLRVWILTHLGEDEFNPEFGSVIDGGVDSDGNTIGSALDQENPRLAEMDVESEIRRWERGYKAAQLLRMENDAQVYGRPTLRQDEVLSTISSIRFAQIQDALWVEVTIKPVSGYPLSISAPIPEG